MLRKSKPEDVESIIELEKEYYDSYFINKNVLLEWINTDRCYILEEDGKIVGSIYFEFLEKIKDLPWEHKPVNEKPNYIYISEVAAKSGKEILEMFSKILEIAEIHKIKAILWLTGEKAKHDKIEQSFLKTNGFKLEKHIKKWECSPNYFISDHNIWMKKLN